MTILDRSKLLQEALIALIESHYAAASDFCGEQRKWHLPRLNTLFSHLTALYPIEMLDAYSKAKDPWGDLLVKEESTTVG